MKAGITVNDFVHEPGKNDAEYIALLEEALQRQKEITNKAIAKIKQSKPCDDAVSRKAVAGIYTALWEEIGTIMDRNEWDDVCKNTANELPSVTPEPRWILCVDGNEPKANADCWISTNAKYVRRASYAPKANNQPNGFIVTEGGFGFYEYGKSAKAWMPFYEPEPYDETEAVASKSVKQNGGCG